MFMVFSSKTQSHFRIHIQMIKSATMLHAALRHSTWLSRLPHYSLAVTKRPKKAKDLRSLRGARQEESGQNRNRGL